MPHEPGSLAAINDVLQTVDWLTDVQYFPEHDGNAHYREQMKLGLGLIVGRFTDSPYRVQFNLYPVRSSDGYYAVYVPIEFDIPANEAAQIWMNTNREQVNKWASYELAYVHQPGGVTFATNWGTGVAVKPFDEETFRWKLKHEIARLSRDPHDGKRPSTSRDYIIGEIADLEWFLDNPNTTVPAMNRFRPYDPAKRTSLINPNWKQERDESHQRFLNKLAAMNEFYPETAKEV